MTGDRPLCDEERGDDPTVSGCVRQHPLAGNASGVRLPDVEDSDRVLDPAKLEQKLDLIAAPPADTGLAPPERGCLPRGFVEPIHGPGQISTPARDEPEDRHVLWGTHAE